MGAGRNIPTGGGSPLGHNPFGGLSGHTEGVAPQPVNSINKLRRDPVPSARAATASRGRVDILRETGGRGGKTVTVVKGFTGIGLPEKEDLAKRMRAACGCGGTVKEGRIEIQGDQRETVARILAEAGFRPVFAGG